MHNIPFIPGGIDNLSRDSRSSRVTYQYYIFPEYIFGLPMIHLAIVQSIQQDRG